jgi:molybdenum cofactor biosynthesis enzyme MoaA
MKPRLARMVLKEAKALSLASRIFLHVMGEPLLHPRINQIVKCAKRFGFKPELFTNGWLLCERKSAIKFLDRIELSFQLLNKEEFEALRPGVEFEAYLERIRDELGVCLDYGVRWTSL